MAGGTWRSKVGLLAYWVDGDMGSRNEEQEEQAEVRDGGLTRSFTYRAPPAVDFLLLFLLLF